MSGIDDRHNCPRFEGGPGGFEGSASGPTAAERDYCGIAAIIALVVGVVIYLYAGYVALSL